MTSHQKLVASIFSEQDGGNHVPPVVVLDAIPLPVAPDRAQEPLLQSMKALRDDPAKLHEYVSQRPVEPNPSDDVFDRVPVESFADALLKGMGYEEDANETNQPFLVEGRPNLLGLGAKASKQQLESGVGRNSRKRKLLAIGSLCHLKNTHRFAIVVQTDGVPGLDMVKVRVDSNQSTGCTEVLIPRQELSIVENISSLPADHPGVLLMKKNAEEEAKATRGSAPKAPKLMSHWIQQGLRVMVVNENEKELYRSKGVIVAVDEDHRATIRLDQSPSMSISRVKEKHLQTIVPKLGQVARVVQGPCQGVQGVVRERLKHEHKVKLELPGEEIHWFSFNDVCEQDSPG